MTVIASVNFLMWRQSIYRNLGLDLSIWGGVVLLLSGIIWGLSEQFKHRQQSALEFAQQGVTELQRIVTEKQKVKHQYFQEYQQIITRQQQQRSDQQYLLCLDQFWATISQQTPQRIWLSTVSIEKQRWRIKGYTLLLDDLAVLRQHFARLPIIKQHILYRLQRLPTEVYLFDLHLTPACESYASHKPFSEVTTELEHF